MEKKRLKKRNDQVIRVTTRERDAILAGLRILQAWMDGRAKVDYAVGCVIDDIRTDSGRGLNIDHIDRLCDRINR